MARSPKTLDRLPLVDEETGDYWVVLETPKGSRSKYKYEPAFDAIKLSATLGEGLAFPYDFGFFPSTLGEDGDPLDVLLFLDSAVPPGSRHGAPDRRARSRAEGASRAVEAQ